MVSGERMKTLLGSLALVLGTLSLSPAAFSQAAPPAAASPQASSASETQARSDAFYAFTMGHIYEEYYDFTSRSDYANQAIEFYKKAYALDPKSPVIGERLAEIYFKAQRIRDAVQEAQDILKREPGNLAARRLLAHIYVRTLGDGVATPGQRETLGKAAEQFREILRFDPSDTDAALWLSRIYRMQSDPEKAAQVLRDLLQHEPENEPAMEQLTQLLLDSGKGAEAVSLLEGIVKRSPTPTLLDMLGDAYTQEHNFAQAEEAYRKAAEMDSGEISHLKGLAQALMSQEKYAAAAEQYKKLIEVETDEAEKAQDYLRLAQIYRKVDQLDLAEENLLQAKRLSPGNLEVIYYEATIYEAQGRFEDAIRVLSDAVAGVKQSEPSPTNRRTLAILYEQLGRLYRETEKYSAAVLTFQEMLRLGEEEAQRARMMMIDTYRAAHDMPKALDEVQKAILAFPRERNFRITRALLMGENGDTENAAKALREMLAGSAEDREIYLDLAQIYERGRRYPEAEAAALAAERFSTRPGQNEMVWFMLGAIYERQKKYDLAEQQFKRVIQLNPHNAAALNYYGYMLADLGTRLDEATDLIKRALAEEPNNGAYLDSLGWAYYKQNRLAEAEKSLRKAVARDSHDPTIRDHLGDVLFKAGKNEMAAVEWERSLTEWRKALPTETEADKIAATEKKLSTLKQRLAQQKPPDETKQQPPK